MLKFLPCSTIGLAVIAFLCTACNQPSAQSQVNNTTQTIESTTTNSALDSLRAEHVMLRVPNFEETRRWYQDKLGFREVLRWKEPSLPGVDLAYLELNGFRLEILGGGAPRKAIAAPANVPAHTQTQGYRHLCFRTNDVDATLALTQSPQCANIRRCLRLSANTTSSWFRPRQQRQCDRIFRTHEG